MQPTSVAACLHYNWYNECHFVQFRGDNTVSSLFWFPTHLKMCGFDTIISLFSHIFVPFYCDFLSFFFFFYCSAFSLGEYISVPLTVLGHPTPSRCNRVLLVLLARNFSSTFITVLLLLLLSFLQVFDRKITTFSVQQWSIVRCFLNQEPASQTLGISFQGMLSSLMKW